MILPPELEAQAALMVMVPDAGTLMVGLLLMVLVPPQLPPLMGVPEEEKRTSTRYCLPGLEKLTVA